MNAFFRKLWWALKPLNKWHIAIYLILIAFTIQSYVTRPAPKVITDLPQVEGVLSKLTKITNPKNMSSWVTIKQKGSNQRITLRTRGNNRYRSWLKQPVVAYYGPAHGFNSNDLLIFMAPLEEKQAYLDDFIRQKGRFEAVKYIAVAENAHAFLYFFVVWMTGFFYKLQCKRDEIEKNKIIKEVNMTIYEQFDAANTIIAAVKN